VLWNERLRDARRELQRRHDVADAMARIDPLTGLGNRRALDEALRVAVAVVDRTSRSLAVLAGDLDGFKTINDRHGHQAGDEALQTVGAVLRDVIRRPDTSFRWGGDEFVVILPDAALAGAQAIADRLEREIAERCIGPDGRAVQASFGAAEHAFWMRGDELLAAADAALLDRKRGDRAAARRDAAA
jgi:diguanylate cyclase (GGDEF)-like protein